MVEKAGDRSESGSRKDARTQQLRATEQSGRARVVHWVESDKLDNLGHGVQFLHDELQDDSPDQILSHHPVAFLEGFNWRDGRSATVRLLGSHPSFITADHWPEIIESTREAVIVFLSNEANLNCAFRHGPIHILING